MISRLLLALALALPLAATAAETITAAPIPPLSLDDCLKRAVDTSKSLRQARRQVRIADWQVQEAWGPTLPNVSANWRNTWRNNDQGSDVNGTAFVMGDRESAAGSIGGTLTLYDFNKAGWYRDALRIVRDSTRLDADRAEQALTLAVTKSYVGVLAATRLTQLAEQEVALLDRQLAVTNDLFQQGQVAANDRMAVEVQRKEREQTLIKARNARAIAEAALNRLIGAPLEEPRELIDTLNEPTWTGGVAEATKLAVLYRPDLASARAKIRAGQAGVKSAKATLMPRLYAFGNYTGTNDSMALNKTWWDGGIGLTFSIYDGGATIAQAGRMFEELAQIEDAADDRLDQVKLDVRQSWLSLSSARERVGVAQSAVALAQDTLSGTQDRYRQGLATSTDVLADEDRLAQALFNHADALYDRHATYAELVHAIGLDPARPIPEQKP